MAAAVPHLPTLEAALGWRTALLILAAVTPRSPSRCTCSSVAHRPTRQRQSRAGILAVPLTIVKATAPLAASLVRAGTGSSRPVAITVAAGCVLGATCLIGLNRLPPPT